MRVIENITNYLIELEVKSLLSCEETNVEWVEENYSTIFCEESIFGCLDRLIIEDYTGYADALREILNDYCDELNFSYIAEEIRKEFKDVKTNKK
jgi:hypothetical protein